MKQWYTAHIIMRVRFKRRRRVPIPLWENLVLIQASSVDEAFAKAESLGREGEGDDDGSFHWEGEPAEWVFAGVRKLTTCVDPTRRPGDGTEVSYLEMEVASEAALRQMVEGNPVRVELIDGFPDEAEDEVAAGARNGRRSS